jgi:hypothetical protein
MAKHPLKLTIVDRKLRRALAKVEAQHRGKRGKPPAIKKFLKYKKKHLDDPWESKGIDESGKRGTWEPNSRLTALRKFGKDIRQKWWSDRYQGVIDMKDPRGLKGGGYMYKKQVTMAQRSAKILEDTGEMRKAVRVAWSPKKKQFVIKMAKLSGKKKKAAYMHLFGKKGITRTVDKRTWRGSKKRGWTLMISKTTYSYDLPKRPWGVWTKRDKNQLKLELLAGATKALK